MDYLKIVSYKYHFNREIIKGRFLIFFNDQKYRQMDEDLKDKCKQDSNAHHWYYPVDYTDVLDPPDARLGANLKA